MDQLAKEKIICINIQEKAFKNELIQKYRWKKKDGFW